MPFGYEFIVIIVMLACSAFFAAYEMAIASISHAKLAVHVQNKRKGAAEALYMKERMEASLAVTQMGMTLTGAIAAATGGAGVSQSLAPYLQLTFGWSETLADITSLIILIIPLSGLTITFAELIPKMFALNNRLWVCLTLSPAMKILGQISYPVISVFELIVKKVLHMASKRDFKNRFEDQIGLHELNTAVSMARTSRLINARQEKIVLSAAQLSVKPVKEIMLPITDVCMLSLEISLSDALIRAHLDMHTRFPVCAKENDSQTIQGYINFKDIVSALKLNPAEPSLRGILRPIKTFAEDTPVSQVLEEMMSEKLHIATVTSKEQRIIGMVTLEDIIEELVGEIEDEYDRLPTYIHPYSGGWIMGGGVPMNVVAQTTGTVWAPRKPDEPAPRLADWCAKKFGQPFKGGEIIESNNLQIMVRKLRRQKLSEAVVSFIIKPS